MRRFVVLSGDWDFLFECLLRVWFLRVGILLMFLVMLSILRRCITRTKEKAIRGCNIRVGSVGIVGAHISEVVVFKVGIRCVNRIDIRVNLVDPFWLCFRLYR